MSTATVARSPIEDRRKVGIEALSAALGHDEAIAFLEDLLSAADDDDGYAGIPGWNYTKWRQEQPEPSAEEFEAGVMKAADVALTSGRLAGKNIIDLRDRVAR